MKKKLCAILASLSVIVSMTCISQVQAESAGVFEPKLDTDAS